MHTIKEVARRSRVSVGTVSNVLSGTVPVSKRLKDRVLDAIQQLDYHPDHVARSLKIRQTRTFGLVGNIADSLFPQVMRGAQEAASSANYILITFNSDDRPEREQQALDALRSRRADGVLLMPSGETDRGRIRSIQEGGTPVVCLGRELADLDRVVVNHFSGARQCVRHLASHGYGRIGLLNSSLKESAVRDREAGYRQGLADAGLACKEELVAAAGPSREESLDAARRMLRGTGPPVAVVAGNMILAIALLQAAREMALRCPEEAALTILDDALFSEALTPALTAVEQPAYEMGRRGVELLLRRMQEPEGRCIRLVLEPILRVRESCGSAVAVGA